MKKNNFIDDLFEDLEENFKTGFRVVIALVIIGLIICLLCEYPVATSLIGGILLLVFIGFPVIGLLLRRFASKRGW